MAEENQSPYLLLVEGEADKKLIKRLCNQQNLNLVEIKPFTPEDLLTNEDILNGETGNGKTGVLARLNYLIPDLADENKALQRLAIIVDADQNRDGQGYQVTFDKISQLLQTHDYRFDPNASQQAQGLVFAHNDGFNPIGVWIMPNNQDDGVIENWIANSVDPQKCHLFTHAQQTVQNLPNRTFTGNQKAKTEVATWLAWQKKPSIGLYAAVPLLNSQSSLYRQLTAWLAFIFPTPS